MTPKYLQLSNVLLEKIQNGIYPIDCKLPTEIELSDFYHVSRQTVRLALSLLVEKGLISKKQGSGNRVISIGANQSSRNIAVLVSHADDYIYPTILHDIQDVLTQSNFSYQVFTTRNSIGLEREALEHILSQSFSGVIVEGVKTALPNPNLALYQRLRKKNVPMIFLHGGYPELEDSVLIADDNYAGAYYLTRYLVSKGHTRIGGIFNSDDIQGHQRYYGYIMAMQDAGLPVLEDAILWYSTEDRRAMLELHELSLLQNFARARLSGCTALVANNDEIAYYAIIVMQNAGIDVPASVAVVSFDNSFYCSLSPVSITSLCHKGEQPGTSAAEQLLRLLSGKDARPVSLPWKLVERQSG